MNHVTLSGHTIEFEKPTGELASFLSRAQSIAKDTTKSEAELIALVYSQENPLLDSSIFPERGAVTKETLEHSVYHVLTDLLARKRVQQDNVDVDKLAARFTLTVKEAAVELGINESAVRQAIAARRVPSWVKEGRYFLDPQTLTTLEVGRRGPTNVEPLVFRAGNDSGASFRIRYPGDANPAEEPPTLTLGTPETRAFEGSIERWRRVGVISGISGKHRFFVLEPAEEQKELAFRDFYVRGKFRVTQTINNPQAAREAWTEFRAV